MKASPYRLPYGRACLQRGEQEIPLEPTTRTKHRRRRNPASRHSETTVGRTSDQRDWIRTAIPKILTFRKWGADCPLVCRTVRGEAAEMNNRHGRLVAIFDTDVK